MILFLIRDSAQIPQIYYWQHLDYYDQRQKVTRELLVCLKQYVDLIVLKEAIRGTYQGAIQ